MRSKPSLRAPVRAGLCSAVLWALLASSAARAQNQGFTVNRYEPTAAGEWSFWVDHPWYSRTRYFAAGLTLNYGHNPLVFGRDNGSGFTQTATVIEHQLLGHLDVAGSFLDRITLNLSLPITLLESGNPTSTITPQSGTVGDPRLGFMVRLWGQPDESPISINLGANFYIPLRAITGDSAAVTPTSSDTGVRILPRLVLAGFGHHIRWSTVAGFLFRPEAVIGGSAVAIGTGSEIQLGVLVNYADKERRFAVGPEVQLSTLVTGGQTFGRDSTSIEVLLGGHYNIARLVQVGLAAGLGALRQPGTPDARVLLRLAYAPLRSLAGPSDRDHDGILDKEDACPDEPGVRAIATAMACWIAKTCVPMSTRARTPIRCGSAARWAIAMAMASRIAMICAPTCPWARTRTRSGWAARCRTATRMECLTATICVPMSRRARSPIRSDRAARPAIATRTAGSIPRISVRMFRREFIPTRSGPAARIRIAMATLCPTASMPVRTSPGRRTQIPRRTAARAW
jgi:hypothetical protein